MKFEVKKKFIDKNSKERYQKGDEYTTTDRKRVKDLQEKGFIGEEIIEDVEKDLGALLSQKVCQATAAITSEFSKEELDDLYRLEGKGQDRKSVKDHIDSLLGSF